jgi:hypothetical protein
MAAAAATATGNAGALRGGARPPRPTSHASAHKASSSSSRAYGVPLAELGQHPAVFDVPGICNDPFVRSSMN